MAQNLLRRLTTGAGQRPFEGWPAAPPIREAPAGPPGRVEAVAAAPADLLNPGKFGPAVVIGLGPTGRVVLEQWLAQLAQEPAGPQEGLRAFVLTQERQPALPARALQVYQADLAGQASQDELAALARKPGRRQAARQLFRQFATFQPFRDTLRAALLSLRAHGDIRAYLLAGLPDLESALVGDVLQTVHVLQVKHSLNVTSRVAIVAMTSPRPSLEEDEIYANLRELGRFTFNGLHRVQPLPGADDEVVQGPLLDHLFLGQPGSLTQAAAEQERAPFEEGLAQALSELLLALTHPASRPLWDRLHFESLAGSIHRQRHHMPVVHSVGVATLHVPLAPMAEYLAGRLAHAAVYGERTAPEGLLAHSPISQETSQEAELLAQSWLRSGIHVHPVFEWLFTADGPAAFRQPPMLGIEYQELFKAHLAHHLTALLNEPSRVDSLQLAEHTLSWFRSRLVQAGAWADEAAGQKGSSPAALKSLRYLLDQWRATADDLIRQLRAWQDTLRPPDPASAAGATWASRRPAERSSDRRGRPALNTDWRAGSGAAKGAPSDWSAGPDWPMSRPAIDATLSAFLRQQQESAEAALTALAQGTFRRAVTADQNRGLDEVAAYYRDTVRPELSRHGLEASPAFRRVRERLGWWVDLRPDQQPELYLICIPPRVAGEGPENPPPTPARFSPGDIRAFGQTLLDVARLQSYGLEADMTGPWLKRRLAELGRFLQSANRPLLQFDMQAANQKHPLTSQAFLAAADGLLTDAQIRAAFPAAVPSEVSTLVSGDPSRVSALTLWPNIPADTLTLVKEFARAYGRQEQLHIYPQERRAAAIEKQLSQLGLPAWLPPEFSLVLADDDLVSLFCQAVLCQLIVSQVNAVERDNWWTVLPPAEHYLPLPLARDDLTWRGLWQSLHDFALGLPHNVRLGEQPTHPFHLAQRADYLAALRQAVSRAIRQPTFRQQKMDFRQNYLQRWQAAALRDGEDRPLGEALVGLISLEMDQPPSWHWPPLEMGYG